MKCALVIATGIKQIMLTAESEEEKAALALLTPDQSLSLDVKRGHFFREMPDSACGYMVAESQGDYLRAYESAESVMLVLRPKPKEPPKEERVYPEMPLAEAP